MLKRVGLFELHFIGKNSEDSRLDRLGILRLTDSEILWLDMFEGLLNLVLQQQKA